ncbi:MAG: hypothetical protein JWM82_2044 [Myxococcales bacterium]|nr:hypothetical protein [Myxococcales bacterium]
MLATIALLSLLAADAASPGPAAPFPVPTLAAAPAPVDSRTAIRANAIIHGFDFTGIGGEVSHSFDGFFGVEGSLDSADLSRGLTGMYGQALGRIGSFGASHAVSLGAGVGLLAGSAFGPVTFAVEEMAYEYRPHNGLSLAVGFGFPITLNDSKDIPCANNGYCFFQTTQFHRGEIAPRLRFALGYSF